MAMQRAATVGMVQESDKDQKGSSGAKASPKGENERGVS